VWRCYWNDSFWPFLLRPDGASFELVAGGCGSSDGNRRRPAASKASRILGTGGGGAARTNGQTAAMGGRVRNASAGEVLITLDGDLQKRPLPTSPCCWSAWILRATT